MSSSNPPRSSPKPLTLSGTVWLASDIHLGPAIPATCAAFVQFLAHAQQHADALILCGDVFDVWIGDDLALDHPEPWLADILAALQKFAHARPLYILHGNRDFLMGPRLARHLGLQQGITDTLLLATPLGRIVVSHGDEYCTDDTGYQRLRRLVRQPWLQTLFLSLPRAWRKRIAQRARQHSRTAQYDKPRTITDVTAHAIRFAHARYQSSILIHGHTHRAAHHLDDKQTPPQQRIVLPDWDQDHPPKRGGWAQIGAQGISLHTLDSLPSNPPGA